MEIPHEWRDVVDLFIGFGRGLARVHARGLVHRDVNPSGGRADARADQYAFCVSLYEALGGRRSVDAGAELAAPRALREILARGLAPRPTARFASISALLSALSRARR
ncbi:MAG: hypothetical protein ABJE66_26535 [Deltaproteobacteria bacterium]